MDMYIAILKKYEENYPKSVILGVFESRSLAMDYVMNDYYVEEYFEAADVIIQKWGMNSSIETHHIVDDNLIYEISLDYDWYDESFNLILDNGLNITHMPKNAVYSAVRTFFTTDEFGKEHIIKVEGLSIEDDTWNTAAKESYENSNSK